ncbi:MAG TPA: MBL fold metallo-hydrolase [Candidatus Angelobacter sp.]|nr:MBL fold metallo-hydrolase [Candidatus Angelobacter sp.]
MQSDSKLNRADLVVTYIGGPTALFKWDGLRILTDPTFDPAGSTYATNVYTLKKREGPAMPLEKLGRVDLVLLSHDHHFDNLDRAGRALLPTAGKVLTTGIGAQRLGGHAVGIPPWRSMEISSPRGRVLRVTATPARHGPVGGDRGPVVGFVLNYTDAPQDCVYISGDTVWYEGVEEVARRFRVTMAVLFMGAAVVPRVGPAHLTMSATEGVYAARLFGHARIVPLHCSGWEHYTESRADIQRAFSDAGVQSRLCWLEPGVAKIFSIKELV